MSLETGRKLGLTASLINVIVPIVTVALYGFFLFSLISTITNAITGRGSTPIPSSLPFLSFGIIWIAFVAVGIISFVGLILFIVAMHQLSQYYNEPIIFRNIIYSLVISIVGDRRFSRNTVSCYSIDSNEYCSKDSNSRFFLCMDLHYRFYSCICRSYCYWSS